MKKEPFNFGNSNKNHLGESNQYNLYDFKYSKDNFDIKNKNDSHSIIANAVKPNSTVLDVGCASGNIGRILFDFKNCIVDGLEIDPEAFKIAKKTNAYRNIFEVSIVDNNSKELLKLINSSQKYDYIIFGDVLEHLYNPYDAIVNASKMLKKNGSILISLPNISHIDIISGLFNEKFNYSNLGLLDKTHIRFFTEKSFFDMVKNIENNNEIFFYVSTIGKTYVSPNLFDEQLLSSHFDIDMNQYNVLQNIFELKISEKKVNKKYSNDSNDNFNKIINKIIDDKNQICNLKSENEILKQDYEMLKKDYETLNENHIKIVNSKRWIFINRVGNFFRKNKRG